MNITKKLVVTLRYRKKYAHFWWSQIGLEFGKPIFKVYFRIVFKPPADTYSDQLSPVIGRTQNLSSKAKIYTLNLKTVFLTTRKCVKCRRRRETLSLPENWSIKQFKAVKSIDFTIWDNVLIYCLNVTFQKNLNCIKRTHR